MIVLWKLCTAVGLKIREIKRFKTGQFLQHCLPASHLLRTYPAPLSWGSGPVINHCASYASCRGGRGARPGQSWNPTALSTTGPRDGHWARHSPCMRFVTGFQKERKKKDEKHDLDSKSPSLLPWDQTEEEANPEEERVQWTEGVNRAVHAPCLRCHVCKPINAFVTYISLYSVSVICYRILAST